MESTVSFGYWVRRQRKALDLTQVNLARQAGCAAVTIRKIERDERRPSRQMAERLADSLVIPPDERETFIQCGLGQQAVTVLPLPDQPVEPGDAAPSPVPAFFESTEPEQVGDEWSRFVGRQAELARLTGHLTAMLAGEGHLVFVTGEAGRGKTALLTEFSRLAQAAHPEVIVAWGHCSAYAGSGDPYLPFRDIMGMISGDVESRWAAGDLTREQAHRLWRFAPLAVKTLLEVGPDLIDLLVPANILRQQARLAPLVPSLESSPGHLERDQLFDQIIKTLQALARRQPLLLLLDDLQWADATSINLLFHLGRRLSGSRILVVGAYRSSEIALGRPGDSPEQIEQHPLKPVITEFKRDFGDIHVDLSRQASDRRAFIEALLDSEPNRLDETFRERLFQYTQGHPLFTVEMLRNMQANGTLIRDEAGQWIENTAAFPQKLPARVEAVIEQRINRLDDTLQDILAVASVEGELFTAQVVARVQGLDEGLVLRRLSRDLKHDHRLVREQPEVTVSQQPLNRYRFGHVLFQEYLYDRLSQGERRLVHRQVAEALEAIFEAHAHDIITPLLQHSDRVDETLDRSYPDCLVEYGPSLAYHFWHGHEWTKAAAYALCVGSGAMKVYAMREAIAAFERAIQALDKLPAPPFELVFEAIIRWEAAAFKFKPYAEQLEQLGRAEQLARHHDDKPRLIQALHWTANVHLAKGLWRWAGPALMECLELAEELDNERLSVRPVYFKGMMTTFVNPRESLDLLIRAVELTRKYEDRHIEALAFSTKAQTHAQLGEFAQAREVMQQAREALQHTDSPLTESDVDLLTGWTYLAMGDTELGVEYGQRGVEKAIATDNMDCICYGFACVGFGNLEMGRIAEATTAFTEAVKRSEVSGAIIPQILGQAGLAMAQFYEGHIGAIEDLETALTTMRTYNNHVGAAEVNRMLGTCLIESGHLDQAEDYLNAALDFYRRMEMRPYLIRTLFTLAQLFTQQDLPAKAQNAQTEAETLVAALSREKA